MKSPAKKDITIILTASLVSAALYILLEGRIMDYGRNLSSPFFLRFLPVLFIQFGMSGLGVAIVWIKNKENIRQYGLKRKNAPLSIMGCLFVSVPTLLFLYLTSDLHPFLPFQGMFLTREALALPLPLNLLIYLLIAAVWGFGEGLFYVVLADKINRLYKPRKVFNAGALVCAVIAILIHGMVGFNARTILEAIVTFILMYGSLLIREKTDNAWGNILIFFLVWNAW